MRRTLFFVTLAVIALGFAGPTARSDTALTTADVPRISIDDLKAHLGDPNWIILDVRTAYDWDNSKTKIKGAIRVDFRNASAWIDKYPKDKTIVFYCS